LYVETRRPVSSNVTRRCPNESGSLAGGSMALDASPGPTEFLVPLFQTLGVGSRVAPARDHEVHAGHLLEAVPEHGAVGLFENVPADLDGQVGPDPEDVLVKGGVMDLAE
jgi:hypothetical protein